MSTYRLHGIVVHVDGMAGPETLVDILSREMPVDNQFVTELTGGDVAPRFNSLVRQSFGAQFESLACKQVLALLGTQGFCINTTTNPGVDIYAAKYSDCGDPASGSVHRRYRIVAGRIYPERISCENGGDAKIAIRVAALKKTGVAQVQIADNVALPTFSVSARRWTLGPSKLGNVQLAGFRRLEVNFGNTVSPETTEGQADPTFVNALSHQPELQLSGISPDWWSATGLALGGSLSTHAQDKVYLRERAASGVGFVVDGTAGHIKFTTNGVVVAESLIRGSANTANESGLKVKCNIDGSGNAPLIVTTETTIT